MVNGKRVGELQQVIADYSEAERRLRLELPGGQVVDDEIRLGDQVTTKFFSQIATGQLVEGPWSAALSECFGRQLRLVEARRRTGVDRGLRRRGVADLASVLAIRGCAEDGDWSRSTRAGSGC